MVMGEELEAGEHSGMAMGQEGWGQESTAEWLWGRRAQLNDWPPEGATDERSLVHCLSRALGHHLLMPADRPTGPGGDHQSLCKEQRRPLLG